MYVSCDFSSLCLSLQVLQTFQCQDFDDGTSFLKTDYSISCNSQSYEIMKWYAVVMLVVFPVGIPVTFLLLLFMQRRSLNPEPSNPERGMEIRDANPSIQQTRQGIE
ncbi:unnamed protein product [Discosporangium mesarthrocarpum]